MEPVFYIYIAVSAVALILAVWILTIEVRLKKLFRGGKSGNMEELIVALGKELKRLDFSREETEKYLKTVERRLKKSVQNVNTIRFNPFENAGSNQSYAVALLDEEGNGVVFSSLYSREGVRVYAKPVQAYESEYTLSDEEKEAITLKKAM